MPGAGGGLFHRSRLWLGSDHLLLVQSTAVSETYRRFYFRSIQNVMVRKTSLRTKRIIALTIFGAIAIGAGLMRSETAALGARIGGFFLFLALIDALLGPTCVCHIRTGVQFERIDSVRRLRIAARVLDRIRPLIMEAQSSSAGALAPDAISPEPATS